MTRDLRLVAAVLIGGFCGTVLRAELAALWPHDPDGWPWGTLIVNVVASAVLGTVATRLALRPARSPYARPLLATGFCGGLSTFSTLQLEVLRMLDADRIGLAAAYVAVSVAAGLAAVAAASASVRRRTTVAT
jgi:CrcB protein